jgi:N-dimethylarginine dimethylaminohydrolase
VEGIGLARGRALDPRGFEVISADMSNFESLEGGVTCLTILIRDRGA